MQRRSKSSTVPGGIQISGGCKLKKVNFISQSTVKARDFNFNETRTTNQYHRDGNRKAEGQVKPPKPTSKASGAQGRFITTKAVLLLLLAMIFVALLASAGFFYSDEIVHFFNCEVFAKCHSNGTQNIS